MPITPLPPGTASEGYYIADEDAFDGSPAQLRDSLVAVDMPAPGAPGGYVSRAVPLSVVLDKAARPTNAMRGTPKFVRFETRAQLEDAEEQVGGPAGNCLDDIDPSSVCLGTTAHIEFPLPGTSQDRLAVYAAAGPQGYRTGDFEPGDTLGFAWAEASSPEAAAAPYVSFAPGYPFAENQLIRASIPGQAAQQFARRRAPGGPAAAPTANLMPSTGNPEGTDANWAFVGRGDVPVGFNGAFGSLTGDPLDNAALAALFDATISQQYVDALHAEQQEDINLLEVRMTAGENDTDALEVKVNQNKDWIGVVASLTTTVKTNLVAAINELKAALTSSAALIARIIGTNSVSTGTGITLGGEFNYISPNYAAAIVGGNDNTIGIPAAASLIGACQVVRNDYNPSLAVFGFSNISLPANIPRGVVAPNLTLHAKVKYFDTEYQTYESWNYMKVGFGPDETLLINNKRVGMRFRGTAYSNYALYMPGDVLFIGGVFYIQLAEYKSKYNFTPADWQVFGGGSPTPAAVQPSFTNAVQTATTFAANIPANYATADGVITRDGGATVQPLSSAAKSGDTYTIAILQPRAAAMVGFRLSAAQGRAAGAWLFNAEPFTGVAYPAGAAVAPLYVSESSTATDADGTAHRAQTGNWQQSGQNANYKNGTLLFVAPGNAGTAVYTGYARSFSLYGSKSGSTISVSFNDGPPQNLDIPGPSAETRSVDYGSIGKIVVTISIPSNGAVYVEDDGIDWFDTAPPV